MVTDLIKATYIRRTFLIYHEFQHKGRFMPLFFFEEVFVCRHLQTWDYDGRGMRDF